MRSDTVLQIRLDFSFNSMSTGALIMTERGQTAGDPYKWDLTYRTCSCYYKQHWQAESRNGEDRDHRPGTSRQIRDRQYIECPLSSHGKKKSIAIYKSRIDKISQILGSKVRSTVYLIRKQNKQDSFGEAGSDCQASRRSVVLIGWLRSSSCHQQMECRFLSRVEGRG